MIYKIIIPAYCPDEHLEEVIDAIRIQMLSSGISSYEIIVVNDGSPEIFDLTFGDVSDRAVILKHDKNLGKGAAMKTAMNYIKDEDEPCVIATVDADGQHIAKDIMNCLNCAALNTGSLILGSRDLDGDNVPLRSRLGNKMTEKIFSFATRTHLSDTQTGLRAFHSSLLEDMLMAEGDRYEYEMNQLLYCVENGIPLREVPIETIYLGNNESSHFNTLRDSVLIYRKLLKFALSGVSSFLVDYIMFAFFTLFFTGTSGAIYSNVLARLISSAFNYAVNRNFVFRDTSKITSSLPKYIALASSVLAMNTCLLYMLTSLGVPVMAAKILTEACIFVFSWSMQKAFVFNNKGGAAQ